MSYLPELEQYDEGIYQLEPTDPVVGGPGGMANRQATQLADRTKWLKKKADEMVEARGEEQTLGARLDQIEGEIEVAGASGAAMLDLAGFSYIADDMVAVSTGNIDISAGGLITMDGVTLEDGNLVLLKDQTDKKENGVYAVAAGAWSRASGYIHQGDDGEPDTVFTKKLILTPQGQANAGNVYFLAKVPPYSIDTDELNFVETAYATRKKAGKLLIRDRNGNSQEGDGGGGAATDSPDGWGLVTDGRNLLDVLGVTTIPEAIQALHNKINADGVPDFSGLQIGDYIDGISLVSGSVNVPWSDTYKNTRIVISGFNTYKDAGSTENAKNHIVFTFDNIPIKNQMHTSNTNTGGYAASTLKTFLEGDFLAALVAALGHDFMYAVSRYSSTKGGSSWLTAKIFPPTEIEVFGVQCMGDELGQYSAPVASTPIQLPIYRDSMKHRIKRFNGTRDWWWTSTPYSASASNFVNVNNNGNTNNNNASSSGGAAPDSVKANYV